MLDNINFFLRYVTFQFFVIFLHLNIELSLIQKLNKHLFMNIKKNVRAQAAYGHYCQLLVYNSFTCDGTALLAILIDLDILLFQISIEHA